MSEAYELEHFLAEIKLIEEMKVNLPREDKRGRILMPDLERVEIHLMDESEIDALLTLADKCLLEM